jgi:hypothetical protein
MTAPYGPASKASREVGLRVLALTVGYEGFTSGERSKVSVAGLVGRGRRLLRAAYSLADAGHGLEAAVLLRSLTEYVFALAWLDTDLDLNLLRWLYDGLMRILDQDKGLRQLERRRRRDAGLPNPSDNDEPLGLLLPAMRQRMVNARNRIASELEGITDLEERLEPRRSDDQRDAIVRAKTLPSIRAQAIAGGLRGHYDLGYTFDSIAVAHPNSLAAEQLAGLAAQGAAVINADPVRSLPDPYAVGAALLVALVDLGGRVIPELAIDNANDIVQELQELKPFAVKSDGPG